VFLENHRFRITNLNKRELLYPLLLASFPLYYFVFAIYAGSSTALISEIYVGSFFIAVALFAYKLNSVVGYLDHALYDVLHNHLFINEGTPDWSPEFCGAVDVLIGLYLIYLAYVLRTERKPTDFRGGHIQTGKES
jgi:cbb3-type cytochrome oxidase subunit 3